MSKFIGNPVIVEAYQNRGRVDVWPDAYRAQVARQLPTGVYEIKTADGLRPCKTSDWIMRGPDGQFSVLRDAVFETMFKPFESPEEKSASPKKVHENVR